MSKHRSHSGTVEEKQKKRALHKDWRTWVAVFLMLGAVGIYVLTLDDAVEVSAVNQVEVPTATTGSNAN